MQRSIKTCISAQRARNKRAGQRNFHILNKLMKKIIPVILSVLALSSCASSTGVIPTGPNQYMVSREDNGPAASLGSLKAATMKDAAAFCSSQGKIMQILRETDTPRSFGQFPQTTLHFTCG